MDRPRFLSLLSFLLLTAAGASAQPAQTNAAISMFARTAESSFLNRVPIGSTVMFEVRPRWTGVVIPRDVIIEIDVPGTLLSIEPPSDAALACSGETPIRCRIEATTTSYSGFFRVITTQPVAGDFKPSASIHTSTPDANASDDRAVSQLRVADRPALLMSGSSYPYQLHPSESGSATLYVANYGAPSRLTTLTLTLTRATFTTARIVQGYGDCGVTALTVVCTTSDLGFLRSFGVEVRFTASDDLNGGQVVLHGESSAEEGDDESADNSKDLFATVIAHILVTNTNDDGSGSLRQALRDGTSRCASSPCTIEFRIPPPVPASGWFTIRPLTPLPDVRGQMFIDGERQTAFTGDTNPDGPEIEIDGSLQRGGGGNGLMFRAACGSGVSGLAMNGFSRHAIEVEVNDPYAFCPLYDFGTTITRNYLGTDARGLVAAPNERGVVVTRVGPVTIFENIISGNRRAGIFLDGGSYASVTHNRIGVNAKGKPLGNGASGIFVNVGDLSKAYGSGADIEDNVIAFNGEWGVCRTQNGEISLYRNSIYGNTSAGIDIGLDNDTPNRPNDAGSAPNKPVLFSATYDPAANTTTVRGRIDSTRPISNPTRWRVDVYASSSLSVWGYAQGEGLVGSTPFGYEGHTSFEVVVPADLRGKFITATTNRTHTIGLAKPLEQSHHGIGPTDTSEFSTPMEVH
jgi:hypothetical protein